MGRRVLCLGLIVLVTGCVHLKPPPVEPDVRAACTCLPDEARRHRLRHVVTNVLGGGHLGVRVDVHRADLAGGDAVLLCTDGLTDMLDEAHIAAELAAADDAEAACERLVAAANDAGGRDNVTAVVARFDDA